jgi:phosphomannomutase/phosphoglucomutase
MCFTPEIRIDCAEELKRKAVEQVVRRFLGYRDKGDSPHRILDLQTIDGVRVAFEKGWGLIRTSNTQPVVVMRVEAVDGESLTAYRSFLDAEFREVLAEIAKSG